MNPLGISTSTNLSYTETHNFSFQPQRDIEQDANFSIDQISIIENPNILTPPQSRNREFNKTLTMPKKIIQPSFAPNSLGHMATTSMFMGAALTFPSTAYAMDPTQLVQHLGVNPADYTSYIVYAYILKIILDNAVLTTSESKNVVDKIKNLRLNNDILGGIFGSFFSLLIFNIFSPIVRNFAGMVVPNEVIFNNPLLYILVTIVACEGGYRMSSGKNRSPMQLLEDQFSYTKTALTAKSSAKAKVAEVITKAIANKSEKKGQTLLEEVFTTEWENLSYEDVIQISEVYNTIGGAGANDEVLQKYITKNLNSLSPSKSIDLANYISNSKHRDIVFIQIALNKNGLTASDCETLAYYTSDSNKKLRILSQIPKNPELKSTAPATENPDDLYAMDWSELPDDEKRDKLIKINAKIWELNSAKERQMYLGELAENSLKEIESSAYRVPVILAISKNVVHPKKSIRDDAIWTLKKIVETPLLLSKHEREMLLSNIESLLHETNNTDANNEVDPFLLWLNGKTKSKETSEKIINLENASPDHHDKEQTRRAQASSRKQGQ